MNWIRRKSLRIARLNDCLLRWRHVKNDSYYIQICFKTWWWTAGASGRKGYTLEMLCHIPLPPSEKRVSKYTMLIWFEPKSDVWNHSRDPPKIRCTTLDHHYYYCWWFRDDGNQLRSSEPSVWDNLDLHFVKLTVRPNKIGHPKTKFIFQSLILRGK